MHILVLALASFSLQAQNINGTWKGKIVMAPNACFPVYNIELQVQMVGSRIVGTVYHFFDTLNYAEKEFEGEYKKDSNLVLISENGVVTFKLKGDCELCTKMYRLSYHKGENNGIIEEQLRGSWTGLSKNPRISCDPGTIVLTRTEKLSFKQTMRLPPALVNKKIELVKEIRVDTGDIRIDFYDNGQVDDDTISVYANAIPVVTNVRLSTVPVSITIRIDVNRPEQELIMVGENLGSIPPNTALMIIHAGKKRYQLNLTSDDNKNAMVRFIYDKEMASSR